MDIDFIDWTSVVMVLVALVAFFKVILVMHAMTELRSIEMYPSVFKRNPFSRDRIRDSYLNAKKLYLRDFSLIRGMKRSWKIQLILCPFWILAADKAQYFEFAIVFGSATLVSMIYGIRFSKSENESCFIEDSPVLKISL